MIRKELASETLSRDVGTSHVPLIATLILGLMAFLPTLGAAQTLQGWDTQTSRVLNYRNDVDLDGTPSDPNVFREHDVRMLTLTLGSGKIEMDLTSSLYGTAEHFGPYGFGADGSITLLPDDPNEPDDQKQPPFEAKLLTWVFDAVPLDPSQQPTWTYVDPPTAALTDHLLEIQQRSNYQYLGSQWVGSQKQHTFDLELEMKWIENTMLAALMGPVASRPADVQAVLTGMQQNGNLQLIGQVVWEESGGVGHTVSASFTHLVLPTIGHDRNNIQTSAWRQEMTAVLLP